ncbi:unnamed protein product [Acanthoscelides obtectus]|uniref:Medium-chain acyl-CoA ligase ACSF2, mitochondrial n=1 Tax=Acanthoscelides obtectus TaxID=200917 RepID=A0A9P0LPS0_ACAOB|nr:unnamed protein product [Acanthoscelides obtectus]CAK1668257.1 Acyl-CoA synthetase family member 2, mitochondrial [Acanthoscelides obtectus]
MPFRGAFTYNDVMNMPDAQSVKSIRDYQKKVDIHSVMNIQFTSGTTGFPKAIPRTHFQTVNNSYFVGKRMMLNEKHHIFCWQVPNFHAFGLIVGTAGWHNGSTIVYPSIHYSPEKSLESINKERCTTLLGTPTMYVDLIREQSTRNEDISPDFALTGGAIASPQLVKDMQSVLNVKTVQSLYGLTESLAAFFSLPGESPSEVYTTVGHIVEHTEAKVVDSNKKTVDFGVPGELCLKGAAILDGYLGDDKKNEESFDEEGWFYTGDQFVMFENGYGNIVGRIKDMIIRGGENIYPKEIEDFLRSHPNILEVHVVGIPHKRLGEEVCACIETKDGSTISTEEVKIFCDKKLAYFKIPTMVRTMKDFPKTTSGKIQKYKLVEQVVREMNNNIV